MKDQLVIIGASGHGKVVADIALKMNKWKTIAFLDDNVNLKESLGLEIIGNSSDALKYLKNSELFVAIGNNEIRKKIQCELKLIGASIPVLIHPDAVIGEQVRVGIGTVIMAGTVINSCTKVGESCIVNTGTTIDHDNIIEDYVHLSPGVNLAGNVTIGKGTWLGIGCKVSNNLNIASFCIVGAGSVVVNDINETGIYVGVPVSRRVDV